MHLNGKIGAVISDKDEMGRWGVLLYESNEIVGVKDENWVLVDTVQDKQTPEPGPEVQRLHSIETHPEIVNRLKRMAYAFVKQDFYKIPKSERRPPTQAELSQMVATRYQCILEEYCTTGNVECSGYEFFDVPDSPVPIFGTELDILAREITVTESDSDLRGQTLISEEELNPPRFVREVRLIYNPT